MKVFDYYIITWKWSDSFQAWRPPIDPAIPFGAIDLRPYDTIVGDDPLRPWMVLEVPSGVDVSAATAADLYGSGESPHEIPMTASMRGRWNSKLGYRPSGDTFGDCIVEQMTIGGDPEQVERAAPVTADHRGDWEVRLNNKVLGGGSVVDQFRGGPTVNAAGIRHAGLIRHMLLREFGRRFESHQLRARRWLGGLLMKYLGMRPDEVAAAQRWQWRAFVPRQLQPHVEGPLLPTTEYTDDFNRGTQPNLGANWTDERGDQWEIRGDLAGVYGSVLSPLAHWTAPVSTDDNEAFADCIQSIQGSPASGPAVRLEGGGALNGYCYTLYNAYYGSGYAILYKYAAGGASQLGNNASAFLPSPQPVWSQADGSTVKGGMGADYLLNPLSVTDTSFPFGNKVGMGIPLIGAGAEFDNWRGKDIISAPPGQDVAIGVGAAEARAVPVTVAALPPAQQASIGYATAKAWSAEVALSTGPPSIAVTLGNAAGLAKASPLGLVSDYQVAIGTSQAIARASQLGISVGVSLGRVRASATARSIGVFRSQLLSIGQASAVSRGRQVAIASSTLVGLGFSLAEARVAPVIVSPGSVGIAIGQAEAVAKAAPVGLNTAGLVTIGTARARAGAAPLPAVPSASLAIGVAAASASASTIYVGPNVMLGSAGARARSRSIDVAANLARPIGEARASSRARSLAAMPGAVGLAIGMATSSARATELGPVAVGSASLGTAVAEALAAPVSISAPVAKIAIGVASSSARAVTMPVVIIGGLVENPFLDRWCLTSPQLARWDRSTPELASWSQ